MEDYISTQVQISCKQMKDSIKGLCLLQEKLQERKILRRCSLQKEDQTVGNVLSSHKDVLQKSTVSKGRYYIKVELFG